MKLWFSANILNRINNIKHKNETVTQFIKRAVEYYVLECEREYNENKKDT